MTFLPPSPDPVPSLDRWTPAGDSMNTLYAFWWHCEPHTCIPLEIYTIQHTSHGRQQLLPPNTLELNPAWTSTSPKWLLLLGEGELTIHTSIFVAPGENIYSWQYREWPAYQCNNSISWRTEYRYLFWIPTSPTNKNLTGNITRRPPADHCDCSPGRQIEGRHLV